MKKDIVVLDLFSGIGGFSKGLTDAGFNITKHYFSEIDKHAIAVYKHQFKNSEYVGSVTTLDGRAITRPNIITFGSPCQDFSVAGKRAGMDGQRSSLIGEALRLITECRPDVFIWENVKGVFSSNNGADFWAIIQAFANIGGYRIEWQLLNTAWFLPQNRERIYLIGHLAEGGSGLIFPFREGDGIPYISDGQTQSSFIVDTNYLDRDCRIYDKDAPTLNARDHKDPKIVCIAQRGRGEENIQQLEERKDGSTNTLTGVQKDNLLVVSATKQGFEIAQEGDSINLQQPNSKTRRGRVGKGVAQTLDTNANQAVLVIEHDDKFRFYRDDEKKSGIQGMDIFKETAKVIDIIDNHPKNIQVCDYRSDEGLRVREDGLSPTLQARAREDKWGMPMVIETESKIPPFVVDGISDDGFEIGHYDVSPARWQRSDKGKQARKNSMKDGVDKTPFSDGNRELKPTTDNNIGCITGATNKDALVFVGGLNEHNRGNGSLSRDYKQQDRVYDAEKSTEAATLASTMNSKYLSQSRIRRLTEIECERLQGFPDNWTEYGNYDGVVKMVAKTQRYKMLGNAVTVRVVEEIGKRLLK